MASGQIWECVVSDGIRQYFASEVEADFFRRDTVEAGFSVRMQPIPVPETPAAFAQFMTDRFTLYRELILAARNLAEKDCSRQGSG